MNTLERLVWHLVSQGVIQPLSSELLKPLPIGDYEFEGARFTVTPEGVKWHGADGFTKNHLAAIVNKLENPGKVEYRQVQACELETDWLLNLGELDHE